MSEKFIVVQGAVCKCRFGTTPDKLKVLSHKKEYANDRDAAQKLIVTTKEIGAATLEKNTFGSCAKMNNNPCKPVITEWEDFYKDIILSNGGSMLLEDSKATCIVAGSSCIEIVDHGQITELSLQNFINADSEIQSQLNPLVDIRAMMKPQLKHEGIEDSNQIN